MLIIGHRGAAGLAPENTIRSFQLAQDSGAQMLECDLRRDRAGKIILSHDHLENYGSAPTLNEFLAVAKLPVNLELKETGLEAEVLAAIKGFAHKVVISSWNPKVLKKVRTLDGNIELGPVLGRKYRFLLPSVIRILKPINIAWITLDVALVNEKSMAMAKKVGVKVYTFTNDDAKIFNDPEVYQRLKNLGVDGIFTDYPNIVSKLS